MKRKLLFEYVYSIASLLTLLSILTLPVVSGKVGYTYIDWTWAELDEVGVTLGSLGLSAGIFTLIAALLSDISGSFLNWNPKVQKILNALFVIASLWLSFVTYAAVGENGPHSLTGLPLYVVLLGGAWFLKRSERFA